MRLKPGLFLKALIVLALVICGYFLLPAQFKDKVRFFFKYAYLKLIFQVQAM